MSTDTIIYTRRNTFLWVLYDFANSVVSIVFYLYFAQWLVIEKGLSDFWFNSLFIGSTILLLLTAPLVGIFSDRMNVRKPFLVWISVFLALAYFGASLTAIFGGSIVLGVIFFLIANYLYQFSLVFYNSLLERVAAPEHQGFISGIGQTANWVGQIFGLLLTLPLVSGAIYFFGEHGRAQAFLPATILFILLLLPILLWFKEDVIRNPLPTINVAKEWFESWKRFFVFIKKPNVGLFLLGYFFFNDAILTAQNNFPIYLEQVFHTADKTKSLLLMGILVTSAFGALISGWVSSKIGLRKSLLIVIGSWVFILPILGMINSFPVFIVATIIMGFLFGSIWTITRAVMIKLLSSDEMNYGMSFYTIAERFATFVGPLSWGLIVTLLSSSGPMRYRIAIASMAIFIAIGFVIVRKVNI